MFEVLARAIDEVEIPVDGAALSDVWGLVDRLTARATMAAADFDAQKLWDLEGATSLTAWLRHRAGMTTRDASVTARTAGRLRGAPVTAGAWLGGDLTGGQVAAICANVNDDTAEIWAAQEASLVPTLAPLPVADVAAAMQVWAARAEATLDKADKAEAERSLHLSKILDGTAVLNGRFDPEATDVIATALRLGQSEDAEGEPARTPARRRADAMVDIFRSFLDHQHAKTGGRHRPHVNLLTDLDRRANGDPAAGQTIDGVTLSPEVISRYLCDSGVHRAVTRGPSTILNYGTRTQTIPAPLFNALVLRDRHCRWPGCDRPPTWCEGHHVWHWEHGGPTCLDNLVLFCSRHHHRAHMPGWHVKLRPDATVEITTPTGQVFTTRPPPPP